MKTKRKILRNLYACIFATFFVFWGVGCKRSENPPDIDVTKPELSNIVVNAEERPTAWFIGDYTLLKVEIDGAEVDKTDYKVFGGYCVLKTEYYGNLGVGSHIVKLFFTEGNYEFSVLIKDNDVLGDDFYVTILSGKDNDVVGDDIYDK